MENVINGPFKSIITIVMLSAILLAAGCSKHLSGERVKANNSNASASSTADSLIGTWKLDKIEDPRQVGQTAAYGSQAENDAMNRMLEQYQASLQGMTVTFNKDGSYLSVYSGQSDVGTWTLSDKKEIRTLSKVTGNVMAFEILTLSGSGIQTKVNMKEVTVLMSFLKK